jgi:hypothetical protein
MLCSSMWALNSYRHMSGVTSGRGTSGRATARERRTKTTGTGLMERLEERWRRRQERDH